MNKYIQAVKTYATTRSKEFIVGLSVVVGGIVLISGIAFFVYNSTPKIIYQPTKACDLFTLTEARELLGESTVSSGAKDPVLSKAGTTAASSCGYTDGNPDTNNMIVAAITVRSGVNDDGVLLNKTEFEQGRPIKNIKIVNDLGDSAYFNERLGQLNILDGRKWIILSYGIGSAPEANTLDGAVELANAVLASVGSSSRY